MGGACFLGLKQTKNPVPKNQGLLNADPNEIQSQIKYQKKINNQNIKECSKSSQQYATNPLSTEQNGGENGDQIYEFQRIYQIGRYFLERDLALQAAQGKQKWQQFLAEGQNQLRKLSEKSRAEIFTKENETFIGSYSEKYLTVNMNSGKSKQLQYFIEKGWIPQSDRWSAWKIKLNVQKYYQKGKYERLLKRECVCMKGILKDIGRAFPEQVFFSPDESHLLNNTLSEKKELTPSPRQTLNSPNNFQNSNEKKIKMVNEFQKEVEDENETKKHEEIGKQEQSQLNDRLNERTNDLSNKEKLLQAKNQQSHSDAEEETSMRNRSIGQESLLNVLRALSNFFPTFRYTQGMNLVVGFFLLVNGGLEEEAFWMFVSLAQSEQYLIMGLYENNFPLIDLAKFIFDAKFKEMMPRLHQHIRVRLEIFYEEWFFQWVITLFLYKFSLLHAVRFWDFIISEDSFFTFIRISLAFLKELEPKILNFTDHGSFHELFNGFKKEDFYLWDTSHPKYVSIDRILLNTKKIKMPRSYIASQTMAYIASEHSSITTNFRENIYTRYFSSYHLAFSSKIALETLKLGIQLLLQNKRDDDSSKASENGEDNHFADQVIQIKKAQAFEYLGELSERGVVQKPQIDCFSSDNDYRLPELRMGQSGVRSEVANRSFLPPIKSNKKVQNQINLPDESNGPAKNRLQAIQNSARLPPLLNNTQIILSPSSNSSKRQSRPIKIPVDTQVTNLDNLEANQSIGVEGQLRKDRKASALSCDLQLKENSILKSRYVFNSPSKVRKKIQRSSSSSSQFKTIHKQSLTQPQQLNNLKKLRNNTTLTNSRKELVLEHPSQQQKELVEFDLPPFPNEGPEPNSSSSSDKRSPHPSKENSIQHQNFKRPTHLTSGLQQKRQINANILSKNLVEDDFNFGQTALKNGNQVRSNNFQSRNTSTDPQEKHSVQTKDTLNNPSLNKNQQFIHKSPSFKIDESSPRRDKIISTQQDQEEQLSRTKHRPRKFKKSYSNSYKVAASQGKSFISIEKAKFFGDDSDSSISKSNEKEDCRCDKNLSQVIPPPNFGFDIKKGIFKNIIISGIKKIVSSNDLLSPEFSNKTQVIPRKGIQIEQNEHHLIEGTGKDINSNNKLQDRSPKSDIIDNISQQFESHSTTKQTAEQENQLNSQAQIQGDHFNGENQNQIQENPKQIEDTQFSSDAHATIDNAPNQHQTDLNLSGYINELPQHNISGFSIQMPNLSHGHGVHKNTQQMYHQNNEKVFSINRIPSPTYSHENDDARSQNSEVSSRYSQNQHHPIKGTQRNIGNSFEINPGVPRLMPPQFSNTMLMTGQQIVSSDNQHISKDYIIQQASSNDICDSQFNSNPGVPYNRAPLPQQQAFSDRGDYNLQILPTESPFSSVAVQKLYSKSNSMNQIGHYQGPTHVPQILTNAITHKDRRINLANIQPSNIAIFPGCYSTQHSSENNTNLSDKFNNFLAGGIHNGFQVNSNYHLQEIEEEIDVGERKVNPRLGITREISPKMQDIPDNSISKLNLSTLSSKTNQSRKSHKSGISKTFKHSVEADDSTLKGNNIPSIFPKAPLQKKRTIISSSAQKNLVQNTQNVFNELTNNPQKRPPSVLLSTPSVTDFKVQVDPIQQIQKKLYQDVQNNNLF